MVAGELVNELLPNVSIKKYTTNTDVIGSYAESSVRRFVQRMVAPARVSTGAVISETLCDHPETVPQIDTIIWIPMPLPPIFEAGEFGLVPAVSTLGVLEIKRSNYSSVGTQIAQVIGREKELVGSANDPDYDSLPGAMGVVCVRESVKGDSALDELIASDKAVVLMEKNERGTVRVNPIAVYKLIGFLMKIRKKMTAIDGKCRITFGR
jgi:hypothetical protein